MDPRGLEIRSAAPKQPEDSSAPSLTPFHCGPDGAASRTACGSAPPAPKIPTSPVPAAMPGCWGWQ